MNEELIAEARAIPLALGGGGYVARGGYVEGLIARLADALEALRKENEAARAYIGDAAWKQYVEAARTQFVPTPGRENDVHYPTGKNTRTDR